MHHSAAAGAVILFEQLCSQGWTCWGVLAGVGRFEAMAGMCYLSCASYATSENCLQVICMGLMLLLLGFEWSCPTHLFAFLKVQEPHSIWTHGQQLAAIWSDKYACCGCPVSPWPQGQHMKFKRAVINGSHVLVCNPNLHPQPNSNLFLQDPRGEVNKL